MNRACSPPLTRATAKRVKSPRVCQTVTHFQLSFPLSYQPFQFANTGNPSCSMLTSNRRDAYPTPTPRPSHPRTRPAGPPVCVTKSQPSPQPKSDQQLIPPQEITPPSEFCVTTPRPPARYDGSVGPQLPQISFEIVAECPHTRARTGLLHTPHGTIETPAFMPVGTQATVKGLSQRDLAEDLGVQILLANTYHLYLRPGHELIRQMGGLHQFMSWPNAILTDSGGFQVFSLSGLRKIDEAGVVFNSHLNGDRHAFTPESIVDVQLAFGSDIQMVLDDCPEYPVSHEY